MANSLPGASAWPLLVAVVLLVGCDAPKPDVVVVLVDSWPAGAVEFASVPHAAAVRAPSTSALSSVVSVLSSSQPTEHGVTTRYDRVGPDVPWLPARMQAAGYRTVALWGSSAVGPRQGLGRGFDESRGKPEPPSRDDVLEASKDSRFGPSPSGHGHWESSSIVQAAREVLADERPTFLVAHIAAAGAPWLGTEPPPEPYEGGLPSTFFEAQRRAPGGMSRRQELMAGRFDGSKADRLRLRQLHGARLRAIDSALPALLNDLPADAVIVVAGTHGEGLDRHGVFANGGAPFEHQVVVPLWVRGAPSLQGDGLELVDLGAWIAQQAGVELTPGGNGALLESLAGRPANGSALAYARLPDGRESWSLVAAGHKLLVTGDRARVYNLADDPDELYDLAGKLPEVEKALGAELNRRVQALRKPATGAPADDALLEQLRILGYVE